MLCAGGHFSHDCPAAKMKSKLEKTEVGHTKYVGNTGRGWQD